MLMAMSEQEELILADAGLNKADRYFCPSCKRRVLLKAGAVMRPHFAHYKNDACEVFAEGETEEHLEGKLQLSKWFEHLNLEVEVEAYLPELRQRPDLLVTIDTRKIAVEFQCSSIPIEKVVERTKGYLNAGYEVVWLLGEKFKYRRKLTGFQKACLTKHNNQLLLFNYFVSKQQLKYHWNFQLNQQRKMNQSRRILRWGERLNIRSAHQTTKRSKINIELEHQKLLRQLQSPTAKTKAFLQLLYRNKDSIISMPKELYTVAPSEWMIQNYSQSWKYQFILWLESFPIHTIITKRMLHQWLQNIIFYDIPQINKEQKIQPIYEFINPLIQNEVLKQIRRDKWTIVKYPKRYKLLEEKFND